MRNLAVLPHERSTLRGADQPGSLQYRCHLLWRVINKRPKLLAQSSAPRSQSQLLTTAMAINNQVWESSMFSTPLENLLSNRKMFLLSGQC
jgi:hypothetical protein